MLNMEVWVSGKDKATVKDIKYEKMLQCPMVQIGKLITLHSHS